MAGRGWFGDVLKEITGRTFLGQEANMLADEDPDEIHALLWWGLDLGQHRFADDWCALYFRALGLPAGNERAA